MMYCRNCGREISPKDRFCPHCGTRNADFSSEAAPSDLDRDQGRKLDLTDAEFYAEPHSDKPQADQAKRRRRPFKKSEHQKQKQPSADRASAYRDAAMPEKPEPAKKQSKPKQKRKAKIAALIAVLVILAAGLGLLAFHMMNGRYQEALAAGDNYLDAKKYPQAYASYTDAVNIFKRRSEGYEGRAAARLAQKKYKAAEKQLKLAKDREDTTYGKALWAALYAHTDRETAAQSQIKQVAIATNVNRRTAVTAGRVCRRIGEPKTGIKIVWKALRRAKTKRDKKALYKELIRLYVAADKSNDDITDLIDRATKDTGDTSFLDLKDEVLVGRPEFASPAGTYNAGFKVRMKLGRRGEIIHYTTDGSTPTETSPQYKEAIALRPETTTTVKMIEINTNGRKSKVVKGIFTIRQVATPKIGKWRDDHVGLMDAMSFSWSKVKNATGYEPSVTTVTPSAQSTREIEKRDATETSATTIVSDTGYKLVGRVRAYVTVDGTRYYSAWSSEITYNNGYDDDSDD